jgi:hypothetical protein
MLGHGQVEGYTEKYGMEYRRAYWDETPDGHLVERHEREIFPLLRKRYLFAEVHDFLLYDFYSPEGFVNEDVFAYSNRAGDQRSLVIYHNKFATAKGWIRISCAFPVKTGNGDEKVLMQKTLGEGLGLHHDSNYFVIFRDHISGLEYIRNSQELHQQGLYAELEAYKYHVFMDFREVMDNEYRQYAHLAEYLGGRGVPSIDEAFKEIFLRSIHAPFRELVNAGQLQWLIDHRLGAAKFSDETLAPVLDEVERKALRLLEEIKDFIQGSGDAEQVAHHIRLDSAALLKLPEIVKLYPLPSSRKYQSAIKFLNAGAEGAAAQPLKNGNPALWGTLLGWVFLQRLGAILDDETAQEYSRAWVDEWLLGKLLAQALLSLGLNEGKAWREVATVKLLINHQDWVQKLAQTKKKLAASVTLENWLKDSDLQRYIGINRYQGVLWFNKEAFEEWLWWIFAATVVQIIASAEDGEQVANEILAAYAVIESLQKAAVKSQYQLELLIQGVE